MRWALVIATLALAGCVTPEQLKNRQAERDAITCFQAGNTDTESFRDCFLSLWPNEHFSDQQLAMVERGRLKLAAGWQPQPEPNPWDALILAGQTLQATGNAYGGNGQYRPPIHCFTYGANTTCN